MQAAEQQVIRELKAELNRVLPAYRETEQKIAARAMERYLSRMQGDENGLNGLEEELAALAAKGEGVSLYETEKLEILRRAGYPVDYLRPAYRCETCRDTGFVDGKKCRCFRQKIIARLCRQGRLAASIERENFDRFSLDY